MALTRRTRLARAGAGDDVDREQALGRERTPVVSRESVVFRQDVLLDPDHAIRAHPGRMRPMSRFVVGMVMVDENVIVLMMRMRVAVRPASVAMIVDVFVRMVLQLRRPGLALLKDHLGLTASTHAAHRAVSMFPNRRVAGGSARKRRPGPQDKSSPAGRTYIPAGASIPLTTCRTLVSLPGRRLSARGRLQLLASRHRTLRAGVSHFHGQRADRSTDARSRRDSIISGRCGAIARRSVAGAASARGGCARASRRGALRRDRRSVAENP